jgi:FMN-dependent NADH-azoreductase
MTTILRINSGAKHDASVSRPLADRIVAGLNTNGSATVETLELSDGVPLVDQHWIAGVRGDATYTEAAAQRATSDAYVAQLVKADVLVISAPIYNFGIPAALKSWIDQIARAGVTFRYTGPGQVEGMLTGKKAIVVVASGGVPLGSPADFVSTYLRFVFGFVGITDVEFVDASGLAMDADAAIARANTQVDALLAA